MVWYGMVWYGMVWYGLAALCVRAALLSKVDDWHALYVSSLCMAGVIVAVRNYGPENATLAAGNVLAVLRRYVL